MTTADITPSSLEVLAFPGPAHRTDAWSADGRCPAVLACVDWPGRTEFARMIANEFRDACINAGLAIYQFNITRAEHDIGSAAACVDTAQAAFDTLAASDEIDPERIAVFGCRLGALIAATAAPRAARLCMMTPFTSSRITKALGSSNGEAQLAEALLPSEAFLESFAELNLQRALDACDRPIHIVHGAADRITPPEWSEAIADPDHSIDYIAQLDHDLSNPALRAICFAHIIRFLAMKPGE